MRMDSGVWKEVSILGSNRDVVSAKKPHYSTAMAEEDYFNIQSNLDLLT